MEEEGGRGGWRRLRPAPPAATVFIIYSAVNLRLFACSRPVTGWWNRGPRQQGDERVLVREGAGAAAAADEVPPSHPVVFLALKGGNTLPPTSPPPIGYGSAHAMTLPLLVLLCCAALASAQQPECSPTGPRVPCEPAGPPRLVLAAAAVGLLRRRRQRCWCAASAQRSPIVAPIPCMRRVHRRLGFTAPDRARLPVRRLLLAAPTDHARVQCAGRPAAPAPAHVSRVGLGILLDPFPTTLCLASPQPCTRRLPTHPLLAGVSPPMPGPAPTPPPSWSRAAAAASPRCCARAPSPTRSLASTSGP